MPFRPELNYFFLYLKKYLEEKYRIHVERRDSNVLAKELMKKISDQISSASFLIADITGNNANVFFELGIAHATSKPVIFLTQDAPKDAPVDIRQFEFIRYELGRHEDFLAKLDNAVRNVLGSSLDITQLYETARDLLKQFNLDSGFTHDQASRDDFHARLVRAAETQEVPQLEESIRLAGFLLPKILQDVTDLNVMERVTSWLQKRGSAAT
jgi:nucleoside 2-deoxyribosyltransferase